VQAVECKPTETKQVTKVGIPPYQQMSLHTASVSASVPHNEVDEQASSAAQHVSDPTEQAVVSPVRRHLRRAYSIKYVELDFPSQPCQSQLLPHVPHQSSDYKTLYAQIDHIIADEDGREIPVILDNDTSSDEEFDCDEPLTFIALKLVLQLMKIWKQIHESVTNRNMLSICVKSAIHFNPSLL
jgi:hypothetical protein